MAKLEGKALKYQLAESGDDQEGEAVPIALTDINGDRVDLAGYARVSISINQSSTNDPVIDEKLNLTGATITATRDSVGSYFLTFSDNVITVGKNVVLISNGYAAPFPVKTIGWVSANFVGESVIQVNSFDAAGSLTDNVLNEASLLINIYP